jgi:hypothetical protein
MYRSLIFIMALVLTGFAVSASTFVRPPDLYNPPMEYPFRYEALYTENFWRCTTPEGGGVRVEGYAVSSTRSSVSFWEFGVRLIARDAQGNIVADQWASGDGSIPSNIDPVPFAVAVPAAGEGIRYDLYYRLLVGDGGGTARGGHPGHGVVRLVLSEGLYDSGTIHDVCSDQYRRKAAPSAS